MDSASKVFAMSMTSMNSTFMMYHYNSYASNPVMLRSTKPLIMRDIFLTKCTSFVPNPLSSMYMIGWQDAFLSTLMHWLCAMPVVNIIGWRAGLIVYVGSGVMSSFAYLFQNQLNPRKRSTKYDCTCSSNGALAGLCILSFVLPKCYIPTSKAVPAAPLAAAWWMKCLADEFVMTRYRTPGEIQLTNWGSIGGVFFGLIFASIFLRTKVDFRAMSTFYSNINKRKV